MATTHYRAEIDLENVADRGSPEFRESFREAREQLGIREIPVEAWIDDGGRIRRFNMEISLDTPRAKGGRRRRGGHEAPERRRGVKGRGG